MVETRIEQDGMGEMEVPAQAYYGPQTERARRNFNGISGRLFPRPFIRALGLIKRCAAQTNLELGLLKEDLATPIVEAALEVEEGALDDEFVVDVFQTGSGTSTNMNANEVIAARANELLGCRFAPKDQRRVHPNDHVNRCQSSNDVIPTAAHVAVAMRLEDHLLSALQYLEMELRVKEGLFAGVVKTGRTHLQDAVPVTLGQVFGGFATQVEKGRERISSALERLYELALGGTAVGTGLNAHAEFAPRAIQRLGEETELPFREADDHFEAQGARDAMVETSGALRAVSVSLMKIANDVRWLASGPRCGIGEITLPALQPGSSIMPGKINPVMAESLAMVCAQVMGLDVAVGVAGQSGNFELNVMIPLMTLNLLDQTEMLGEAAAAFAARCVRGIEPRLDRIRDLLDRSLALVTVLAPEIGYDRAAELAKEAWSSGRTIPELVRERGLLPEERLDILYEVPHRKRR